MTPTPAHSPEPSPAPLADPPPCGEDVGRLIAAAERTAEMPLAAFAALAELLTYICERDRGRAA
jgi:hypothetical protein